jgi:ABC-type bacteriocin/lantibiotic exporter with double-glycine peptidase domain
MEILLLAIIFLFVFIFVYKKLFSNKNKKLLIQEKNKSQKLLFEFDKDEEKLYETYNKKVAENDSKKVADLIKQMLDNK